MQYFDGKANVKYHIYILFESDSVCFVAEISSGFGSSMGSTKAMPMFGKMRGPPKSGRQMPKLQVVLLAPILRNLFVQKSRQRK